jgi:hypothetical protein
MHVDVRFDPAPDRWCTFGAARVYNQRMVTFGVNEVSPASEALPTRPLRERVPEALTIGGDPATPIVDHGVTHPLLGAVGLAFAQHRPLVLSPDAVWLTIAQGIAQHVRLNAEALRPRLVRHDGRARLSVTWDGAMPEDAASWTALVAALRSELAAQIGDGRARLFECDFSTSTDVERVASQVVMLDAYAPYFSYWMTCACGIPAITLTGTPADWRRIRERVDVIAELGLERWCRSLVPITDQLVRAAAGDADVAFWRRIYNPIDAYGADVITGWITRLYPYLVSGGVMGAPNSMLDLPIDEPRGLTAWRNSPLSPFYSGPGLRSNDVPDTRARVAVRVVDRIGGGWARSCSRLASSRWRRTPTARCARSRAGTSSAQPPTSPRCSTGSRAITARFRCRTPPRRRISTHSRPEDPEDPPRWSRSSGGSRR